MNRWLWIRLAVYAMAVLTAFSAGWCIAMYRKKRKEKRTMDMVLSGAKIIGNGPCRGVYNGMVDAEIERQKKLHREQVQGLIIAGRLQESGRVRMTKKVLAYLERDLTPPSGRLASMKRRMIDAWCIAWGCCFAFGLIEDVKNDV